MMSKGWLNRYLAKVEIFRVGMKHLRPDLSRKSRCLGANASPCQDLAQRVRSNNRQDLRPDLSEKSRCLGANASPCQDFSKRANRLQKLVLDRVLFYLSYHGRAKDSDSLPWVSDKGYRPNPSPLQIKLLEMLLILASLTIGGAFTGKENPALAQLIPDDTLGGESSVVNPIDNLNDRIDGGAIRGVNSFQSFLEFNVGEGRGVYFANPDGILNILTRVTGNNPSNIFGRLGVLGDANLFLINPNGIVFGKNASLDINGSFVATTANAISLGNNGYFSASEPGTSNLLSVNPGALFFNQVANQPGSIINHGNLGAGKDLTLAASNVNLQGQLYAGRDLTLFGLNTLQVRDSVNHPFIAVAEGKLLLQGNQNVDIFALNHPDSGFYSGGDMVLRSGNTVGGDAHYWSGGSFRIEQLDGNLGDLDSPNDPIIRSRGDVSFNNYFGASLHIFAGGSVTIPGSVFIRQPDPVRFITEDITLSNGEVVSIDGSVRPTFDVRAGMNPADVGIPIGVTGTNGFFINANGTALQPPRISNIPTSADITINRIAMFGAGAANGLILLTNQYKPNTQLSSGNINIGSINTDGLSGGFTGNSGSVFIDSRNNILITNSVNSSSLSGNAGDITLIADDIISVTNGALIGSDTLGAGEGGNLTITTGQLIVQDGAKISASTYGRGYGGKLTVNASELVQLIGTSPNGAILSSLFTATTGGGKGGDLTITTPKLHLQDGTEILVGTFGSGDGGNLIVNASESVQLIGTSANGQFASGLLNVTTGTGNGGDSIITTPQLLIQDGGILQSGNFGSGKGGNLIVNASESVQLIGTSTDGIVSSSLYAQTQGTGNGGDLTIITPQLLIADGGFVGSDTFGAGKGGNLIVNTSDSVQVIGTSTDGEIFSSLIAQVYPDAEGDGGNLTITTGKLTVSDRARVSTATLGAGNAGALTIETEQLHVGGGAWVQTTSFGSGNAGVLTVNASESVELIGISPDNKFASGLYSQTEGTGNANELIIATPRLLIQEGAQVSTGTFGSGKGGSLIVKDSELVQVIGTSPNGQIPSRLSTTTAEGAQGKAGDLTIITGQFIVQDGAQVSAGTVGSGNGGNFIIKASESVQVMGRTTDERFASGLFTQTEGVGDAGDLTIITPLLLVEDGSLISASTLGLGDAGNLIVNASKSVQLIGTSTNGEAVSGLATQTRGEGDAGDLIIITPELLVQDGARVSTGTFDAGNGGTLTVNAAKRVQLIGTSPNGQISSALVAQANNNSTGDAGDLILTTPQLLIQDGAVVSTGTLGSGDGGNLIVNALESVEIIGRNNDSKISSGLFTQTQGTGNAGDLTIITGKFLVQDGARVSARTLASGNGGNLIVNASQSLQVIGISADGNVPSSLSSSNEGGGIGEAGDFTITTPQLIIRDGAQVSSGTIGSGNGGSLTVNASELVQLIGTSADGKISSGLFTSTRGTGNAGELTITTPQLHIQDGAQISAATFNQGEGNKIQIDTNSLTLDNQSQITTRATGEGNAGPIFINVNGLLTATDSDVSTNSTQSAGGAITITAENIRLFGDSDIKTNVSQGAGGGGNITIKADNIIAFDDSDILAFARDGKGGDITLDTDIFFGSSFAFAPKNTDPETLDINDRVDINASGAISGNITIPDVSFIENSLTELPDNLVDPDSLIANSCIARSTKQTGNFIITGSGGLPLRPEDPNLSPYPTGTVRNIPNDTPSINNKPTDSWQIGDPIIEPQGVYQLPSGKLVMSRECSPSNP